MMPDRKITDAVERGVDSSLMRLRNRKGTAVKVLCYVLIVLAVGYVLGASFGMPAVG